MSKFAKGDRIVNLLTNEKSFIIEVFPPSRGRQMYKVKYDDRENDENSTNLVPEVDLTNPSTSFAKSPNKVSCSSKHTNALS